MKILNGAALPQVRFVVCDADGSILRTGSAPLQMVELQARDREAVFIGDAFQDRQYIDVASASVRDKPALAPAVDGLTITNLPAGCTAYTEGQAFPVTGGTITLTYDLPGTYSVLLQAKNWLDATVEVVQP